MIIVYAIPAKFVRNNIAKSSYTFEKEGLYPTIYCSTNVFDGDDVIEYHGVFGGITDNFTDTLSILEAGYDGDMPLIQKALMCPRYADYNGDRIGTITKVFRDNEYCNWGEATYARYWHGYLVAYKPLLQITSYEGIRKIFHILEYALILFILFLLVKKNRKSLIFPVLLSFWFICPEVIYRSLAAYPMFLITFIQPAIFLLAEKFYENKQTWLYHFLIVGCLTSFIDYLTFPSIGYAIPLLFLLTYKNITFIDRIIYTVKCGVAWVMGYVGMWSGKWILASLLTKNNVISDAFNTIAFRTAGMEDQTGNISKFELIKGSLLRNSTYVEWFTLFVIIALCFAIISIINKKQRLNTVCNIFFFIIPFLWYIVCANHSYIHYWFTYRTLTISIFTGCIFVVEALSSLGLNLD